MAIGPDGQEACTPAWRPFRIPHRPAPDRPRQLWFTACSLTLANRIHMAMLLIAYHVCAESK
jgi:hypothetical protein